MTESSFRKLLLRFALVPVLAVCAFLAILGFQLREITKERARASQATSIVLVSNELLNGVVDEETGVRGYLVSQDRLFLEPYQEAITVLRQRLNDLSGLTSSDPSLAAKVQQVTKDFEGFDAVNQELLKLPASREETVSLLGRQKRSLDTLRTDLGGVIAEENNSRETHRRALNDLYEKLPIVGIFGGLAVAILLVWHGIYVFHAISRAFRRQLNETEVQRDSFRTTLNSIGDAVIVCDGEGKITLLNPTAEQVSGWSNAEAIGEPLDNVFRIINEYSREPVESPVSKVIRLGQVVGLANHTLLIRKDGSEISIDDSGSPIRDRESAIVGVVLVFRDIEARRIAERELALRTAELEAVLFHSPAGFASFDRAYRYVRVNKALADINGVAQEDHFGKTLRDIVPANAAKVEPLIDHVFRGEGAVQQEITGETFRQPGVERQWVTCFYPVMGENGTSPVLTGAMVLETTDRWRAQQSLLQSEKLVAVGRLAASIAHELNNPLASVTNLLYLIAQDEEIQGETREYVARANIELARASKIATQTLRFAKRSMSPTTVNLDEVLDAVLLLFHGRLILHQVTVVKRIRKSPSYFGHANELMQLLTNLIGNALDAMQPEGKLIVGMQETRDWKTGVRGVSIGITDSGSGIPEASLSKIWEPFFTTKQATGTGLGLWLVGEMVKKNNGSIRLRTSTIPPYQGTTFRIFMPAREHNEADGRAAMEAMI